MATTKQKRAFKEIIENHRNKGAAMVAAGYSKKSAIAPSRNLTNSKGWKELLEIYLPDKDLIKVHKEGLAATKRQGVGGMVLNTEKGEFGHTDIEVPDYATRHRYLETAYKVKGKVVESAVVENKTLNIIQVVINPPHENIGNQSNSETIPSVASSSKS